MLKLDDLIWTLGSWWYNTFGLCQASRQGRGGACTSYESSQCHWGGHTGTGTGIGTGFSRVLAFSANDLFGSVIPSGVGRDDDEAKFTSTDR